VVAAPVMMSLATITSCSSNPVVLPTTAAAPSSSLAVAPTVVASTAPPPVAATASTVRSTTAAATTGAVSAPSTSTTVGATTSTTPPTTETTDPLLDPSDVDADVVVQAFETLTFDQESYTGKADLTLGLFDQAAVPHTLLIEGRSDFRLEVNGRGDSSTGDVVLRRGTYTLYCELPGHRAGGMEAKLVIP
jgi:hypothetical protein